MKTIRPLTIANLVLSAAGVVVGIAVGLPALAFAFLSGLVAWILVARLQSKSQASIENVYITVSSAAAPGDIAKRVHAELAALRRYPISSRSETPAR